MRETLDQKSMRLAYDRVRELDGEILDEFAIAAHALGANVLRHGPIAAVGWLARQSNRIGARKLLDHLAAAEIPGVRKVAGDELAGAFTEVCRPAEYRRLTRHLLVVIRWARRAVEGRRRQLEHHEARSRSREASEAPEGADRAGWR